MSTLPRRVPWLADEFEPICALLFASADDAQAQRYALDRIAAWSARGCCPQAVESTAHVLGVLLHDRSGVWQSNSALQLAYAMALTRFVNGLVDPAQQSAFARPVATIARELGLPLWFVELRHASTHTDLPSLASLRSAAQLALDWLRDRYWLPQRAHGEDGDAQSGETSSRDAQIYAHLRRDAVEVLAAYKVLRKTVVRDTSRADSKELDRLVRAAQRIAVAGSNGLGVEAIVSALLEQGALVPVSRKKRTVSLGKLALPTELEAIWRPLIDELSVAVPAFRQVFVLQALELLCFGHEGIDVSHAATAAAWLLAIIDATAESDLRETTVRLCLLHPNPSTAAVLKALSAADAALKAQLQPLMPFVADRDRPFVASGDVDALEAAVAAAEARYAALVDGQQPIETEAMAIDANVAPADLSAWSLMPPSQWRPCPIGSLPDGRTVSLDLPQPIAAA